MRQCKLTSHCYFEGERFIVNNGSYERYIRENKSVPRDDPNILLPDVSGCIFSEFYFMKSIVRSLSLGNYAYQSNTIRESDHQPQALIGKYTHHFGNAFSFCEQLSIRPNEKCCLYA